MPQPRTADRGTAPKVGARFAGAALSVVVALASLAGCGGQAPPTPEVPGSFPQMAFLTLSSDSGALQIALRAAPDPFVVGQNVGQITITDGNGQPVDGLTMSVLPWMPAHAHGTSVTPAIIDDGGGVFVANPLYLFMAGEWQLRMTFGGTLSDTATATVEIN